MSLFDDTNNLIKQLLDGVMQQLTITDEVAYVNDNVSKVIRTRVTAELCSTLVKLHNLKISDHKSIIKKFEKEKSRMPTFEDFLSGKGINYIFCYLNASEVSNFSNEEILANTQDQNCLKTKDLIVYLLAVYLRYVALIWGATSGVYISGSMANTLLESINHTTFRTEFENSPTMKELLLKIPIYLIKELDLGLRGGLQLATKG